MYAVIYKDNVIIGPKEWASGFFEFRLRQLGLKDVTIPRTAPANLPFIIDDNTKIVVAQATYDEINPMTQYHTGPIWTILENYAIANYVATDTPLEQAKANFKNLAATERYKKEIAGTTVTIQERDVTLDTSRDGRNIFLQKYSLMNENDTANWKFPECWLTLTKAELGQIVMAGAVHIQSCFDWEKSINDQIEAVSFSSELLSINIVDGESIDGSIQ